MPQYINFLTVVSFVSLTYESTRRKRIKQDLTRFLSLVSSGETPIQALWHSLGPSLRSLPLSLRLLAAFGAILFPSV